MSGVITSILTDSEARSAASVKDAFDQQPVPAGAWF
jgi:hypothetical protein